MIIQTELKRLLNYDPDTGDFTWLVTHSSRAIIGNVAGSLHPKGYINIQVLGIMYRAHRLAWFYMTGSWPKDQIDHKNLIKSDNAWNNLREATNAENQQNQKKFKSNETGFPGVSFYKRERKFVARITINQTTKSLGYFDTPELAHAVYLEAKCKLHKFFNPEHVK